jgi:hypothetical protein
VRAMKVFAEQRRENGGLGLRVCARGALLERQRAVYIALRHEKATATQLRTVWQSRQYLAFQGSLTVRGIAMVIWA